MEKESKKEETEIEESSKSNPLETVNTKVPEVEIHLFRQGKGPIDIFKSSLGGWEQDQLEVSDILEKYGLKSLFAFNPKSGRGVSIRFSSRNGRSLLPYKDGSVIFLDGEPKDSLIKPVSKIAIGIALMTFLIAFLFKDPPDWIKRFDIMGGTFPPWALACAVIVFTRLRKRTRDILKRYGW
ncbi:hypothetical protein NE237_018078 [Protea cynaroides]|uniref:Uncharacterized protein n=1 Tax=Protea cynaroides TaxID=273540 RepID=A0A9Q0K972_9MAGN|nr:hypothetical protein NE237_018078 [Protea cynaroides]